MLVFCGNGIELGLFLATLWIIAVGSDDSLDFQKSLPALLVWGTPGEDVELPCDVTANKNDRVSMVLWFKDTTAIPVYSLDARAGPIEYATHWAMSNDFGSRSNFLIGKNATLSRLHISRVVPSDQGIYRCRIDYNNSPTKNYKLNFSLIVQPSEPIIYDAQGREVIGVAGPFMEGYDLFLSCHVVGGRPRPKVTWWSENQLLDNEMESIGPSLSVNQYFRSNVSRTLYNSKLKCQVLVTETSPPLVNEVRIEVYLKPRFVKMNVLSSLLSSGRPQQYQCDSWGSVPPAKIIWLLEGEPVQNAGISVVIQESNLTSSVLTYKPIPDDDGKELTCRAENPRYPGSILEESMELTVLYPPEVSIKPDPRINLNALREGDEVRLFCIVRANPKPTHISWFHGELFVYNSPNSGVQATEKSLEIRRIHSGQAGDYSCAARNTEGEARSNSIPVRVLFPPRCKNQFKSRTVGALKRDTIRIRCEVDADPSDDVKFSWTFNTSGDVLPLPAARVVSSELFSHIDFTPISDADFGTLACWAVNGIGRQEEPCMTHIIPAKVPESPKNCELKNHTVGGVEVTCAPGYDGGLQQHFMLEVAESSFQHTSNSIESRLDYDESPKFKVLSSEPEFTLRGLESGTLYTLSVYGINAKGRSEPPFVIPGVRFGISTARLTSTESMKNGSEDDTTNPMAIVLGTLIGLALLVVVAIVTAAGLFLCKKKNKPNNSCSDLFVSSQKKIQNNPFQVPILSDTVAKSKKINNSARKSVHEILPLEEVNSLKPFADSLDNDNIQTAVIRKNRGSAARQIRNSLSLSIGNPAEVIECRPIPVDMKPLNLINRRNSAVIVAEESETEVLKDSTSRDEPPKKAHARVTLNPEGEVLKCVIEGAEDQNEESP